MKKFLLAMALQCFLTFTALANLNEPLRDFEKFVGASFEKFVQVLGAKVVVADYTLIRQDFPHLRSMSNFQIDHWLIENAAWMTYEQVSQQVVNDKIHTNHKRKWFVRPKNYGRAAVAQPDKDQLIDIKGSGTKNPKIGDHSNGLMSTAEGIRDFIFEKMLSGIFKVEGNQLRTVGSYAVLDLGFKFTQPILNAENSNVEFGPLQSYLKDAFKQRKITAGLLLRQAHLRSPIENEIGDNSFLPEKTAIEYERVLRKYGIVSSPNARFGFNFEAMNIQGTVDGAMVDFGGLAIHEKSYFSRYVFNTEKPFRPGDTAEKIMARGQQPVFSPTNRDFPQPSKYLAVKRDQWVIPGLAEKQPTADQVRIRAEMVMEKFSNYQATRADIETLVGSFLNPVFDNIGLGASPFKGSFGFMAKCQQFVVAQLLPQ